MAIQTTIPGTDRDETLNNRGRLVKDEVLLDAAGGNDTVDNEGNLSSIMGGDGKDSISNKGNYVSIRGGTGDDTVLNSGNNVSYFYDLGDGNDTIYGFNPSDKVLVFGSRLYPSSWTLKSSEDGKDNLVIGKGRTKTGTFTGTMTYKDLNGGALHLAGIPGLEGSRKEIFNHINGSTITGGFGDDTVNNYADNVLFCHNNGDGDDIIHGFNATSTLKIGDGTASYSTKKSGDDIIVNVYYYEPASDNARADYQITLTGAANLSRVNIIGYNRNTTPADSSVGSFTEGNDTCNNTVDSAELLALGGDDSVTNSGASVTIDGMGGNDYVYNNHGASVSINGGEGNDTIRNDYGTNMTIDGGEGDDSIDNIGGSNVSINAGDGNDSIYNSGASVTIDGMGGNDYVYNNHGTNVSINGGEGNDTIKIYGTNVSIDGGTGDDSIDNEHGTNMTIDGGAGDDTIDSYGTNVTINGGTGDDSIKNGGTNVLINGGTGDDSIKVTKFYSWNEETEAYDIELPTPENVTVDGDDGNDTIKNDDGTNVSINGGEGNDTIDNRGTFVTVDGGAGDDDIYNSGTNVSINGGEGNDTIWNNSGTNVSINGGEGNDTIWNNSGTNVSINGGEGNDDIWNAGSNVSINAGDGNDTIWVTKFYSWNPETGKYDIEMPAPENVTVDGGAGDDSIDNGGTNVTIDGGAGDDDIWNAGSKVSINAGDGNDTIQVYAGYSWNPETGKYDIEMPAPENVTVSGGDGDDQISLTGDAKKTLIEYTTGDGKDTVYGFDGDDTLKIGNGTTDTYSKATVDNDIIVTVGDGSVLLKDAASLDAVNIAGTENVSVNPLLIILTEKADKYSNSLAGATIQALDGNDSITNGYYTAATGYVGYSSVSIDAGAGNDTIYNRGSHLVTIDGGTGKDGIYNYYSDSVIVDGGIGDDSLENQFGNNVTINAGEGNDSIWNYKGSSLTFNGGDGNDTIYTHESKNVTINGGTGNDEIYNGNNAHKYSENVLIEYADGDGNDTVTGFNSTSTLKIGNGTGTYSTQQSGDDIIVTVGDGSVLLKGAATLDSVNIAGEEETPADNWTFNNGVAKYKNLFTLSGINPNLTVDELDAAIEIDGNKIILSANALGKSDVTLTTTGNYSLALGDDCPTVTNVAKGWTIDGTTATYHEAGKTDGYKLTNTKTVTYTAATVGKALLTVNGVVDGLSEDDLNDNLTVSGKVLTVTPEVVGENFSVDAGYKVVFSEGDYGNSTFTGTAGKDTIEVNGSGLQISLGAGNDTVTSNGDGGNTYMFDANGGKDVVKGYNSDDVIKITDGANVTASVKGSDIIVKAGTTATMTLKNAATGTHLNVVDSADKTLIDETVYADRIVVDDGATLLSAFNATNFTAEDPIVKVDASVVTKRFSLTGGDGDNTLIGGTGSNFINGGDGSNELTGGKGNDTFVAGNGVDTITDYGNGTDKISLTASISDFTVEGDDVIISFDDDKSMTIADGAGKKIYFLQNGKSSTEIFDAGGKMNTAKTSITLNAATDNYTAASTIVTIDGSLTNGVNIVGNAKANKIFGSDYDDTLNGGTKNATLTGGGGEDIFIYETGKIVISDYVSGDDRISLGASPTAESLKSNGDVFLKFGSDSLTIKKVGDTSNGRTITFTGEDGDTTKTYFSEKIVGDDGITLTSSFAGNFVADGKVDASSNAKKITLTGGDDSDTLIGGKGTNVLNGNAGDDILIGNGGADTFVYSSGDDTITDYESKDKISLTADIADFTLDNDDVIINFDDGSLTISDAANSAISFVETVNGRVTTNVNVFASDGIFNKAKTAVTLKADASSYTAAANVISIDGGLATDAIEIVGNSKANKIYAGNNGSTIDGGSNNDSLWGGNGSDTFIYSGGNDVIYGFGDGDALNFNGDFTASVKSNSIAFKVGSTANAVTLKDYSATTFNVNGNEYAISNGSNFVKK